jgi:hypothetical protein
VSLCGGAKGRFEEVGSYPEMQMVLGALIRGRPKAAAGSKEGAGERSGMPCSGRACRSESELNRGSQIAQQTPRKWNPHRSDTKDKAIFHLKQLQKGEEKSTKVKGSKGKKKEYFENRSESNFSNEKINSKTNSELISPKKKRTSHISQLL